MQISVRVSLLIGIFLAVTFAVVAFTSRDNRKRLRIESDLRSMGAYHVGFDENNDPDSVSFVLPVSSPRIANYKSFKHIDLAGANVTDASIRNIAGLQHVMAIHLTDCDVTDSHLAVLANVGSLKILRLNGSDVTDDAIPFISSINDLMSVDLSGTLVTDDGVARLKERCPGIAVRYEPQ